MNLINLFFTASITENIVLTKFLGMCPFIGVSNKEENAVGMGISVMVVILLSSLITFLLYHFILIPTDSIYLTNTIFIFVIATCVQTLEILLKRYNQGLYNNLGIYLPLITTNCAVLGIVLLNINNNYNFIEMIIYNLGSSLGFALILYVFSSIREELVKKPIRKNIQGVPIALITIAIITMIFSRLGGS